MAGKLIMTWDIAPEKEQEYFEFVVREFLPDVQRFGFTLSDAWVTVYGDRPQIMVSAVMPSIRKVEQAMESEKWQSLIDKLLGFVTNFQSKIVRSKGGFQF
ncbi:MAG: hypothetical protein FJZ98_04510 [Chloroflexi bacterium]|nr:hypothetical protein [Chloroflexota bacterium]